MNICRKHSNWLVSMETNQILSSIKIDSISVISCLIWQVEMQVIYQFEALLELYKMRHSNCLSPILGYHGNQKYPKKR